MEKNLVIRTTIAEEYGNPASSRAGLTVARTVSMAEVRDGLLSSAKLARLISDDIANNLAAEFLRLM